MSLRYVSLQCQSTLQPIDMATSDYSSHVWTLSHSHSPVFWSHTPVHNHGQRLLKDRTNTYTLQSKALWYPTWIYQALHWYSAYWTSCYWYSGFWSCLALWFLPFWYIFYSVFCWSSEPLLNFDLDFDLHVELVCWIQFDFKLQLYPFLMIYMPVYIAFNMLICSWLR